PASPARGSLSVRAPDRSGGGGGPSGTPPPSRTLPGSGGLRTGRLALARWRRAIRCADGYRRPAPSDVHEDPERRKRDDERRTAEGDERERHARHGKQPRHRAEVHQRLQTEPSDDPRREQPAEPVRRPKRDPDPRV